MTFSPAARAALCTLIDGDIGLTEVLSSFRVADDHVLHAYFFEHVGGNFTGESAGFFKVAILSAYFDVGAFAASKTVSRLVKGTQATTSQKRLPPGVSVLR